MTFGVVASSHPLGGASAFESAVLTDSPLVYLRLGEPSGTTATDSSGNGRNGTYVGSFTFSETGLVGDSDTAVTPGGTDDYVQVAYGAWMNVSYVTVMAAVKISSYPPDGVGSLANRWDNNNTTGDRAFELNVNSSGHVEFRVRSGSTESTEEGTTDVTDGSPHLLHGTFDGSTIRVYVDGVEDGSGTSLSGTMKSLTTNMYVAARDFSGSSPRREYAGVLDEVALFGSALSGTRIAAHATAAGV